MFRWGAGSPRLCSQNHTAQLARFTRPLSYNSMRGTGYKPVLLRYKENSRREASFAVRRLTFI
jgi:hypothetical protein